MKSPRPICSIEDCGRPARARGWCNGHWIKWRKANPNAPTKTLGVAPDFTVLTQEDIDCFWVKVEQLLDGCWTRGKGVSWYTTFHVNVLLDSGERKKVKFLGHRLSYYLANGPIPDGLVVRHHCDNLRCVRPDHLTVGIKADNVDDMTQRNRNWQSQKTSCNMGHPYTPDNIVVYRGGRWACRTCNSSGQRKTLHSRPIGCEGMVDWAGFNAAA